MGLTANKKLNYSRANSRNFILHISDSAAKAQHKFLIFKSAQQAAFPGDFCPFSDQYKNQQEKNITDLN